MSSQLHARHRGLANVATELLHFFMEKNVNFQNVGVVENMFALVDNEDNVSNAVVTIIASQTLEKPENLIDSIFTRIDSSKPTERKNAIKIISKLFEIIQNKESGKEKKSQIEKLTFVTFFFFSLSLALALSIIPMNLAHLDRLVFMNQLTSLISIV